jgi:hypothetical protein
VARVCTECGNSLSGADPRRKTCGDACRAKRSRRLHRQKKEAGEARKANHSEDERELALAVRTEVKDVGHEVLREELRPIVRESITEETIRAIGQLVRLTPTVVEKLAEDIESEDSTIRQKAYSLVAKYTLGHPAIVQAEDQDKNQQLVVNFELPRPGADIEAAEPATEIEFDEIRQCDKCGEDKPLSAFVANSYRCQDCFNAQQHLASEMVKAAD